MLHKMFSWLHLKSSCCHVSSIVLLSSILASFFISVHSANASVSFINIKNDIILYKNFENVLSSSSNTVTFYVNDDKDDVDANVGDGICETTKGVCSLRAAVQEANASFDETIIHLPAGIYRLSIPGSGEDKAITGDLDIVSPVTIQGNSMEDTIIEGGGIDRVFDIGENAHPGVQVKINNLTIRDGTDNGDNSAGGVRIRSYKVVFNHVMVTDNIGEGIGIDKGSLSLFNVTIKNNTNIGVGGIRATSSSLHIVESTIKENNGAWGGISSDTYLNIVNSAIYSNKGSAGPGGLRLSGKAIITNSTISSNIGSEGAGAWINDGDVMFINTTITANQAQGNGGEWRSGDGGGVVFKGDSGSVIFTHTILSGNSSSSAKPNCAGTFISLGYNLLGDLSGCNVIKTAKDMIANDAGLAPLADNGGTTYTHALLPNSPAVDAGNPLGCFYRDDTLIRRDQINHPRPLDGNNDGLAVCDIGAYEFYRTTLSPVPEMVPSILPSPIPTITLSPSPTKQVDQIQPTVPASSNSPIESNLPQNCKQLIINSSFEENEGWVFPQTKFPAAYDTSIAHTGLRSIRTGIVNPLHNTFSYSSAWQQITIPMEIKSAQLGFWFYPIISGVIEEVHGGDLQLALLLDYPYWSIAPSPVRETLLSARSNSRVWTKVDFDITKYAGRTIWLYFGTFNNGAFSPFNSSMALFVDDVSLVVCQ